MKTYRVRRSTQCPTGEHVVGGTDGVTGRTVDCTCPWLTVESSQPVPHMMQWSQHELERLIKEFDAGYFDPQHYPDRKNSMFISAHLQELIRLAEADPASAVLRLLGPLPIVALAWCPAECVLSIRLRTMPGLPPDWAIFYPPGVEQLQVRSTMPGGSRPQILWQFVEPAEGEEFDPQTSTAIRSQVRQLLAGPATTPDPGEAWSPAAKDETLIIDGEVVYAALSDPEIALVVQAEEDKLTAASPSVAAMVDHLTENPPTRVRGSRPRRRANPKES